VLFLCNISQYVKQSFLLWLEEVLVSVLRFTNKKIQAIVENYEERNEIYAGCCKLTAKPKEYRPLVMNAANPPIIIARDSYAATHNCKFLPLVT